MDTTDPDIEFDAQGVCSHCQTYDREVSKRLYRGEEARERLTSLVSSIRARGKGHDYDCVIGVSGGVDSTYVAYLVKELQLRPLAIHFDNGWNSETAVSNISKTLNTLDIDLKTFVIDWDEFKSLQIAFLRAGTPDGEVPTDHAISALLFREAARRGITTIISGMNYATESSSVPAWAYGHMDWKYIRSINRKFGTAPLRMYPHLSLSRLGFYSLVKRIRIISILNYIEYNKSEAMRLLQEKIGWQYYGGKHFESVYTRFYQGYVLPQKYNIDKRKAHLSALINSGQETRERALKELEENDYLTSGMALQDYEYVQKKLGFTKSEFESILSSGNHTFRDYPNSYGMVRLLKTGVNALRLVGLVSR